MKERSPATQMLLVMICHALKIESKHPGEIPMRDISRAREVLKEECGYDPTPWQSRLPAYHERGGVTHHEFEDNPYLRISLLCLRIDELSLSVRPASRLAGANINYIGDLVQKTEKQLLEIEGLGRKSLDEIEYELGMQHLWLGMEIKG